MTHLKFGYPLIGAVAAVAMLAGCADESPWGNTSNEKGSISISLTTDSGIATAKPVFRSGEEETATPDPNDLSTYITVPTAEDFSISLEKADGKYSKTWTSLADFKTEAANSKFDTGSYTLTAYYGTKGTQDFEAPYFEATSTFTVLSDQTQTVDLEAELKNSMVKVNYTQAFKDYMNKGYSAKLHTEGRTDDIEYNMTETRPAFIEPKNANLTVHFSTDDNGGMTSSLSLGDFAPLAKTLHNITFDIGESTLGNAALEVTFDESLEEEPIIIDLTEELKTTPAPTITCTGFQNGATIDLLQTSATANPLEISVFAEGKVKSATLTIQSTANYTPAWGNEINLCAATKEQQQALTSAGIETENLFDGKTDKIAIVKFKDLTFDSKLPGGEHTIQFQVTDSTNKVSDPVTFKLNSEEITASYVAAPAVNFGSKAAYLTLNYNGINPETDITFTADGTPAKVLSWQDITGSAPSQAPTRASETRTYQYKIELANSRKNEVKIQVIHKGTKTLFNHTIPVTVPKFSIGRVDAFSKFAYLEITTPDNDDANVLAAITDNIVISNNGSELRIEDRDTSTGIIAVTGLTSGTSNYTVNASIKGMTDNWNVSKSFDTEPERPVPNGDFETLDEKINTTIDQGGKWTITDLKSADRYTTTLSMLIKEPTGWFSSNSQTCNLSATPVNSWYVVPSVYNTSLSWISKQPKAGVTGILTGKFTGQEAYTITPEVYKNLVAKTGTNAMIIRNVAWDSAGPSITEDQKTGDTKYNNYYCSNTPSSIANRTAGFMRLGTATEEGVAFASRPVKLKGFYKYVNDSKDTSEKWKITVEILHEETKDNQVIVTSLGSGEEEFGAATDYSEFVVPITYTYTPSTFMPKATKLKIYITSSNKKSGITTTDYCNKEECCSRGATLTVDNLTFEYK